MTKDEKRPARTNSKGTSRLSRNRWLRYGPLVVWASLIFIGSGSVLSAEHTSTILQIIKWFYPSASPAFLASAHFLVRKAGHLTEYAILATLAARAFRNSSHQFIRLHWFILSLLLAAVYALTDEFHQSFVPSRTASLHDSLIDSAGALMALSVIWFTEKRRLRIRSDSGEKPDRQGGPGNGGGPRHGRASDTRLEHRSSFDRIIRGRRKRPY